jgi:hypothetical protein
MKTKLVGSMDGGFSCKGCIYQVKGKCERPEDKPSCITKSRIGRARCGIYIEDKGAK